MKNDNKVFQRQFMWNMDFNMAENPSENVNDISDQVENINLGAGVSGTMMPMDERSVADVPKILIATNLDAAIFEDEECRCQFEDLFKSFDQKCQIQYLKSFHRARIQYELPIIASKARIRLHETLICGKRMKLFFAQPLALRSENSNPHLELPAPVKQFLISPPASPPVGWQPLMEAEPVINYDLLAALAHLTPGEAHELQPPSEQSPAIVIHVCEDPEGYKNKVPILQTRRPDVS